MSGRRNTSSHPAGLRDCGPSVDATNDGKGLETSGLWSILIARGRLPMSLLRWEITGLDDEVRRLWDWQPIPAE